MSTGYGFYCTDCDSFDPMYDVSNNWPERLTTILPFRHEIAALATFAAEDADRELKLSGWNIDVAWFAKHHTHNLTVRDEYGNLEGKCNRWLVCDACKKEVFRCTLPPGHEPPCVKDAP